MREQLGAVAEVVTGSHCNGFLYSRLKKGRCGMKRTTNTPASKTEPRSSVRLTRYDLIEHGRVDFPSLRIRAAA